LSGCPESACRTAHMLHIEEEKYITWVITFVDTADYSMLSLFSAIRSFARLVIVDG